MDKILKKHCVRVCNNIVMIDACQVHILYMYRMLFGLRYIFCIKTSDH